MKLPLDKDFILSRRIRSGYGVAFLLLLISYCLVFFMNGKLTDQSNEVVHTNEILTQLELTLSNIKDAETGVRGYLVMKDDKFLVPYYESVKQTTTEISALRSLINSGIQQKRVDTLNVLIVKKMGILKGALAIFENAGQIVTDSLKTSAYNGKEAMDEIRILIAKMKEEEKNALIQRNNSLIGYVSAIKVINIISLLFAFLIIAFSIATYNRENKLKNIADSQALLYRTELEEKIKTLEEVNNELIELRRNEKFAVTGRIARTIAHEVKNPLTNINLAAEQLKDIIPKDEETTLLFDMIQRNGSRINHLVSDLLKSTKVPELKFDNVSINQLLDESIEMAKDRIELNQVKVNKHYTPDMCEVSADKEQIKTAFLNLIVNAIEATEPGKGELYIRTDNRNDKCVVTIADNGAGMHEDDLARLFEPYFTSKPKGTGLGLTHTQNIILNHKGVIHVESKPGKGTKFEISLDFA